jgi:hypothetical protein
MRANLFILRSTWFFRKRRLRVTSPCCQFGIAPSGWFSGKIAPTGDLTAIEVQRRIQIDYRTSAIPTSWEIDSGNGRARGVRGSGMAFVFQKADLP